MLAQKLGALILQHPLYRGLPDSEAIVLSHAIEETLGMLLSGLPEDVRREEYNRMEEGLNSIERTLFEGVNTARLWGGTKGQFFEEVTARYAPLRDGLSVHLELGTYVAWPKERVDAHVARQKIGDLIRLDMNTACPIDIAASVTALPFHDESIDRMSSNSLFEHCAYPHEIIREAFRVLRPGGQLMTVAPFHFVEHKCPADYLRFTPQFFEDVCKDAGFEYVVTESKSSSGVYFTLHQLVKAAVAQETIAPGHAARRAHIFATALLALLQSFDKWFHADGASFWHSTSALAIKPGEYVAGPPRDRTLPFINRYEDILICPRTAAALRREGELMVTPDRAKQYPIENNVPNLFVLHGFGSGFTKRASSRTVSTSR